MSTALSSPRLLVGDELVGNDLTLDVVDPSTGEVFLTVPRATRAQAEAAVAAAKAAYPAWRATPLAERRAAVNRFADVIDAHRDELAAMLVREQSGVYDALCAALAQLAATADTGPGLEDPRLGPIQNRMQFEKAKAFLEDARRDGTVIEGGTTIDGPGYFVCPTVVRDIAASSPLVRDEQFAPILPVVRFDEIEEALAMVNSTSFGLGASVWSGDPERAYEIAQRIDAATVWINHHLHLHPSVPVEGTKESGSGANYGVDGMKQYTQGTVIRIAKRSSR